MHLVAMMLCDSFHAIHIIWVSTLHLGLDSWVSDPEIFFQVFGDDAQDVLSTTHALLVDHDVAATTNHTGADRPDVQIVYFQHSMDVRDCLLNLGHVHSSRNRL